jgi:hypothetical protein
MIAVGSDRVDAVSIGMPIDAGAKVIVTSIEAGKIHVRPATDEDVDRNDADPKPQSPPSLEGSLESYDFE